MKLIKSNTKALMFQKTNTFGDQIIEIKDLDDNILCLRYKEEGQWYTDEQLTDLFNSIIKERGYNEI